LQDGGGNEGGPDNRDEAQGNGDKLPSKGPSSGSKHLMARLPDSSAWSSIEG